MNQGAVLAVHSHKGGTGKTLISINLAAILARQGKNVCLIDLDLRAPSLDATFAADGKYWINDFLSGKCEPTDILKDFSKERGTDGRLLVGLADPSADAIREIATKDRRWEMRALRQLLSFKQLLINKVDYIIIDTGPGMSYGSINAVAASDLVVAISTWDVLDVTGIQGVIGELYKVLERTAIVIMNKIPEQLIVSDELRERLADQFKRAFKLPVAGFLPCYCDIMRHERASIIVLDKPYHPFSKSLAEIGQRVEKAGERFVPSPRGPVDIRRSMETFSRLLDYKTEIYRKPEELLINRQRQVQTHLNNLKAIKSIQQIAEDLYQSVSTYYSKQVLEKPISFMAPPRPQSLKLIEKLSSCPTGHKGWKEYEEICKEILTFLFVPPLVGPLEHVRTESGLQIRDLIFHIPCNVGGFWDFVQRKYDAVAIIVECKNYANPIGGNNVVISSKYLGERRLGLFGMVISRFPPAESAFKERARLWTEDGKLILCLEDEDLKTMIKLKDEGKEPEIILDKKQRNFLQSLE